MTYILLLDSRKCCRKVCTISVFIFEFFYSKLCLQRTVNVTVFFYMNSAFVCVDKTLNRTSMLCLMSNAYTTACTYRGEFWSKSCSNVSDVQLRQAGCYYYQKKKIQNFIKINGFFFSFEAFSLIVHTIYDCMYTTSILYMKKIYNCHKCLKY